MTTHVRVESTSTDFLANVCTERHVLLADEPVSAGGGDAGATPYELLLAALGACKVITLRMYAKRKGFPLERVQVSLTHAKVHAEDCASCEREPAMVDRIDVEIGLAGGLSDEQRNALLAIAAKCPVHRTLTSMIQIRSRGVG